MHNRTRLSAHSPLSVPRAPVQPPLVAAPSASQPVQPAPIAPCVRHGSEHVVYVVHWLPQGRTHGWGGPGSAAATSPTGRRSWMSTTAPRWARAAPSPARTASSPGSSPRPPSALTAGTGTRPSRPSDFRSGGRSDCRSERRSDGKSDCRRSPTVWSQISAGSLNSAGGKPALTARVLRLPFLNTPVVAWPPGGRVAFDIGS